MSDPEVHAILRDSSCQHLITKPKDRFDALKIGNAKRLANLNNIALSETVGLYFHKSLKRRLFGVRQGKQAAKVAAKLIDFY